MAQMNVTRHIAAPPAVVFQYASDFRHAAGRIKNIRRVEVLTDGPVRKGTRFRETRVIFGREATEEMEVLEFDPPNGYLIGCESCGCRYRSTFRFRPAAGGTELEMTFQAEPLSFLAKIMSVVMAPMLKKCMNECAKDLDDLRSVVENEGRQPTGGAMPASA